MFGSYEEVLYHWFPFRRAHYEARVARIEELFRLRLLRWQNVLRYIDEHSKYALARRRKAEMEGILTTERYNRFDESVLKAPKHMSTDQLRPTIVDGENSTFNYLLRLNELNKSAEGRDQVVEKIDKIESKISAHIALNATGRFPGAATWDAELEALRAKIAEGESTRWLYGDSNKFTFD